MFIFFKLIFKWVAFDLMTLRKRRYCRHLITHILTVTIISTSPTIAQNVTETVPLGNAGRVTVLGSSLWQQSLAAAQIGDALKASEFARKACLAGAAVGCARSGELLLGGLLGPPSPSQAANHFDIGCQLGNANACHAHGLMLLQGIGIGADMLGGRRALQMSCDKGNTMGCTNLGSILASGAYGPPDCKAARLHFEQAIQLWSNNAQARTMLRKTNEKDC